MVKRFHSIKCSVGWKIYFTDNHFVKRIKIEFGLQPRSKAAAVAIITGKFDSICLDPPDPPGYLLPLGFYMKKKV